MVFSHLRVPVKKITLLKAVEMGPWWWSSGNVPSFYSVDPSLNPAAVYNFSVKIIVEKKENKQKKAVFGPFFKKAVQIPEEASQHLRRNRETFRLHNFNALHLLKMAQNRPLFNYFRLFNS